MSTLTFPALDDLEGRIAAKQAEGAAILAEAQSGGEGTIDLSKVTSIPGDSAAKAAHMVSLNAELGDLAKQADVLRATKAAAEGFGVFDVTEPGAEQPTRKGSTSFGARVVKAGVWHGPLGAKVDLPGVDLKTLMSRSAGWNPESLRDSGYLEAASAPIMLLDRIPMIPTTSSVIKYMEQTTRTNNAAERAEGGTYGEAAFVLTEQSVTVETVGVWLPVTDEQLEDEAEAADMVDFELPLMVRQRLDSQALVGNGTTPNVLGINNKGGIQTQAKGADPTFDAVLKAATKVRVTGRARPDTVVFHPNDWQELRLTRTADGLYILGNPNDAAPDSIWGLRVAESDNQTENTAVVGAFAEHSRFRVRRDVLVEKTNSHSTDFINGRMAIRAGIRACFVWRRAAAFCTVTGI